MIKKMKSFLSKFIESSLQNKTLLTKKVKGFIEKATKLDFTYFLIQI